MKKVLKWIGIVLGGVLGLIMLAALIAVVFVTYRLNRPYDVIAQAVAIPTDEAAIARGEHLVRSVAGCNGCHGKDLGGMVLLDDPLIMRLYAPNLTAGEGGAAARYTDEDWDRAIRQGVGLDGRPLVGLMPAGNFRWMSDEDLGAIVAYIKTLGPVDRTVPDMRLGPMGYLLALTEPIFLPAEKAGGTQPQRTAVEPAVTAEYGEYLVWLGTCRDCHGPNLSGRQLPLPDEPPSRNLTPGGELIGWSQEDFIRTIRTGVTPGGDVLREPMAGVLDVLRGQTDDELAAIFLYLRSLPAKEFSTE